MSIERETLKLKNRVGVDFQWVPPVFSLRILPAIFYGKNIDFVQSVCFVCIFIRPTSFLERRSPLIAGFKNFTVYRRVIP